jgi:pyruvate kinase
MMLAPNRTKLVCKIGPHPVYEPEPSRNRNTFARRWVQSEGLGDGLVVLTAGPSRDNPEANHRLGIIDLRPVPVWNNAARA